MADDAKDLEKFLNKVDDIESIIKGLSNNDSADAVNKADEYIEKLNISGGAKKTRKYPPQDNTGVNRTVINHDAFRDPPPPSAAPDTMDQEAFMKVMEVDAQERRERRKKDQAEATIIKDEGNVAFKEGDYEKAVELYTKALSVVKDLTAVWTNRAQAYIKLGRYDEALSDCDWALRVDENCVKAYVHRGRAYLAQARYEDAITAYTDGLNADPSKEKAFKGYIEEVERAQTAAKQEVAAQSFLESGTEGATGLVELVHRVCKPDQHILYYTGGLQVISQALTDDTSRTLFRTQGGLEMVNTHPFIAKCWVANARTVSVEEADMLAAMLDTFTAAMKNNAENERCLLTVQGFAAGLLRWGGTSHKGSLAVRRAVVRVVYAISETEFGQKLIVDNVDIPCLLDVMFTQAKVDKKEAIHAACCLRNMAQHAKFRSHVKPTAEDRLLAPCEALLASNSCPPAVLVFLLDMLASLSSDTSLRVKTASRATLWEASCTVLKSYEHQLTAGSLHEDVMQSLLGLVIRLTPDLLTQPGVTEALTTSQEQLTSTCVRLVTCPLPGVSQRATGVLSHLLPPGGPHVNHACQAGAVPALLAKIQEGTDTVAVKAAVKALTACTQHAPESRQTLLDTPKGLSSLVGLLKGDDESVVGNAALCLGHMVGMERVAGRLTKTNIVQHLLVKARDGRRLQLQHNCSILLAKLAKADQRHLERLRDLHGVEILVDVMRHVKT